MKMTEAKKIGDARLDGIAIEITRKDNSVHRVIFKDTKGNIVEICKDGYSGIDVLIPAPPEKKKVWNLKGIVIGFDVDKNFESEYEANRQKEKFLIKDSEAKLEVSEIEVTIE